MSFDDFKAHHTMACNEIIPKVTLCQDNHYHFDLGTVSSVSDPWEKVQLTRDENVKLYFADNKLAVITVLPNHTTENWVFLGSLCRVTSADRGGADFQHVRHRHDFQTRIRRLAASDELRSPSVSGHSVPPR
jgi:hypothetical protein